jgi:tetratricopeptide (TPR) repeat protein
MCPQQDKCEERRGTPVVRILCFLAGLRRFWPSCHAQEAQVPIFGVERFLFMEKNRVVRLTRANSLDQGAAGSGQRFASIALFACLPLLVTLGGCQTGSCEQNMLAAEEAAAQEDWDLAAELWYDIHWSEGQKTERSYLETGRALFESGSTESACAMLRQGHMAHPQAGKILELHGEILEHRRFSRAAEGLYAEWVDLEPDNPTAQLALGRMRLTLGWECAAMQPLELALMLDPESAAPHIQLARLRSALGEPVLAFEHYFHGIERGESDPRFLIEGARAALSPEVWKSNTKAVQLGLAWADRVVALQPQNTLAHYLRGAYLDELERPAEAIEALTRAVETDPGCLPSLTLLITLCRDGGYSDRAQQMLDHALLIEQDPPARQRLSGLLAKDTMEGETVSQK